jgi:hypothetical protein
MKVLDKIISAFLVLFGTTTVNAKYICTTDACRVYQGINDNLGLILIFGFLALAAFAFIGVALSVVTSIVKKEKRKNKKHR